MKNLTRKNLNELAAVMPVLSENELREYVGGALYVDSGGGILGWDGTSYEMIVTDTLPSGYMDNPQQSGNFTEQPDWVKRSIISFTASTLGIGNGNMSDIPFMFYEDENEKQYAKYDYGKTEYNTEYIGINTNSELYKRSNNYHDYIFLLTHEIHHAETPEDRGDKSGRSELEAYKAMLNHHSAEHASHWLYEQIYQKYFDLYQKLPYEERIKEELIINRNDYVPNP